MHADSKSVEERPEEGGQQLTSRQKYRLLRKERKEEDWSEEEIRVESDNSSQNTSSVHLDV